MTHAAPDFSEEVGEPPHLHENTTEVTPRLRSCFGFNPSAMAMQAAQAQPLVEEVDEPLGEIVLTTGLIFEKLWHKHLDADDKKALRSVSRSVSALANAAVETLDAEGLPAEQLASALALFPSLTALTLDYPPEGLPALSAALLPRLCSLQMHIEVSQIAPCDAMRVTMQLETAISMPLH
jgi:hypothetical protein